MWSFTARVRKRLLCALVLQPVLVLSLAGCISHDPTPQETVPLAKPDEISFSIEMNGTFNGFLSVAGNGVVVNQIDEPRKLLYESCFPPTSSLVVTNPAGNQFGPREVSCDPSPQELLEARGEIRLWFSFDQFDWGNGMGIPPDEKTTPSGLYWLRLEWFERIGRTDLVAFKVES